MATKTQFQATKPFAAGAGKPGKARKSSKGGKVNTSFDFGQNARRSGGRGGASGS
jgi:hypothetical protein